MREEYHSPFGRTAKNACIEPGSLCLPTSLSFIHAKFDNKTKEEFSSWYVPSTYVLLCFSTVLYIGSIYRKVASSNTSRLEAHAGFFRLLMKGIFILRCTATF